MTATIAEFELVLLEDMDTSPACEGDPCSDKATWILTRTCCDNIMFLCDRHTENTKRFIEQSSGQLWCLACDTTGLHAIDFMFERI